MYSQIGHGSPLWTSPVKRDGMLEYNMLIGGKCNNLNFNVNFNVIGNISLQTSILHKLDFKTN